ncbi:hypothetical protein PSDVSF_22670 [Pseudodesulfovibrio sediminis]|uniref:Uncharacterized protein n=1 Tax=Pseudodesulfovibrio sediminis TaxID=2810563 RepID=A0ABN6EU53_9BACT|nr:hypothetical protein PSDVSF_22670 [Pseudodesulfovibrio sediminis]
MYRTLWTHSLCRLLLRLNRLRGNNSLSLLFGERHSARIQDELQSGLKPGTQALFDL